MRELAGNPIVHWLSAALAAAMLLLAAHPVLTQAAKRKPKPQVTNSKMNKAVFSVTGVKPGQVGRSSLVIQNKAKWPVVVRLTQSKVTNTGFGRNLQFSIYDTKRKMCVYPRPSKKTRKGPCRVFGAWKANGNMRKLKLPNAKGKQKWKRKEKHLFVVTWRLAKESPNSDQGRKATFALVWRATKK